MALPSRYSIEKKINSMEGLGAYENGGKGSGNFGHSGRPGKVGGSGSGKGGGDKGDVEQKKARERMKELGDALADIPPGGVSFDEKVVEKLSRDYEEAREKVKTLEKAKAEKKSQTKDYKAEQEGVDARDGYRIGSEFADLQAQLSTARTNLKMLKKDSGKSYDDLAGRSRYLTRQSEIARAFSQARALGKTELSKETKKLVKEMESELKSIMDTYTDLGTKKYFDPDLNHEN